MKIKKNAQEVFQAAQDYFAACDATREQVTLKSGAISYYQVPYTMAGLAASLGVGRQQLEQAIAPGKCRMKADVRAALVAACARVEQHTVERALLRELSGPVAAMLLKGWGYGEQEEQGSAALVVTLEDKEGFGR